MKAFKVIANFFTIAYFLACRKPFNESERISNLQYKWTIDSLLIYNNPQFAGSGSKIIGAQGYTDIRINGIQYSYLSINNGVSKQESFDTAYYIPKLDMKSMMVYPIINGNSNYPGDSLILNIIGNKVLVMGNTTKKQNGYFRYYYHK